MGRTPFEVAESWERDLALSDCLILDDLTVIKERDPQWYESLVVNDIRNIILYAIRYNQMLVGFIWAANYDTSKKDKIKETLELSTFIIAAVIANHQLVSRLEIKSTVDALTQVGNRNAMKDLIERYSSGSEKLPEEMGIAYADLNGLKAMNDTNGHEAGDRLLVRAASLLKLAFDGYDIFRIGGDEFVVLCNGIKKEELDLRISRLRGLSENTGDVSFAIGSEHCVGEYDLNSAIQTADGRMYKDKVEFYKNHPERNQRK
jgi:diguanylate cyclase (GGDEF)-like protein